VLEEKNLVPVLTHELGHGIALKLTESEWKEFYKLRGIPSGTPKQTTKWELSPEEDFTEVYAHVLVKKPIQTQYGKLKGTVDQTTIKHMMGLIERFNKN